jgi:hypothetical protein
VWPNAPTAVGQGRRHDLTVDRVLDLEERGEISGVKPIAKEPTISRRRVALRPTSGVFGSSPSIDRVWHLPYICA